jgi:hypothetical protein
MNDMKLNYHLMHPGGDTYYAYSAPDGVLLCKGTGRVWIAIEN